MPKAVKNKGFTLVELLVVITIIAILATIGLVMYSSVQKSARISKRIQDLKAIQTALELYYSVNKQYPTTSNQYWYGCPSREGSNFIPELVPTYMPVLPADPQMTNNTNCYVYRSNGTDYKLISNPAEIICTATNCEELLAQPSTLCDPYNQNCQNNCGYVNTSRKFAVWSSATSRCW